MKGTQSSRRDSDVSLWSNLSTDNHAHHIQRVDYLTRFCCSVGCKMFDSVVG